MVRLVFSLYIKPFPRFQITESMRQIGARVNLTPNFSKPSVSEFKPMFHAIGLVRLAQQTARAPVFGAASFVVHAASSRVASSSTASGTPRFFSASISRAVGPNANCASSRRNPSPMYDFNNAWYPEKPRCGAISFMDFTTSAGMRTVIEIMGRSFASRVLMRSEMLMVSPFLVSRLAGRNDADAFVLDQDMHHEQ
jgi:hypothetical protein